MSHETNPRLQSESLPGVSQSAPVGAGLTDGIIAAVGSGMDTANKTNLGTGVDIKPSHHSSTQLPDSQHISVDVAAGMIASVRARAAHIDAAEREQAYAFVKQYARKHRENFTVFSLLVPRDLKLHVAAVYAFCRAADDLADDNARTPLERERALIRLRRMREMLHEAVGEPLAAAALPATVLSFSDGQPAGLDARLHTAIACTIAEKRLSLSLFDRLLDAFEYDQRVTRHQTWQDLIAYSANSANPVGQLVLQLHGLCLEGDTSRSAREMLAMSDAICTGLQLTNFWQDVRRDLLERDRIYIPLADAGLTGQQLGEWVDRPNEPPVRRRMCDEVLGLAQRTRVLFAEGADLPTKVPSRRLGWMIWLFLKGGEETLSEVERSKGITLWQRPTLSTNQRLSLVLQATLSWLIGKRPTTRR